MKLLVASLLAVMSFAASALTLEPLPGTTAQFTVVGAAVPEPIGVIVRDEGGQPVEGVAVTFSLVLIPGETGVGFFPPGATTVTVLTDEFGIAMPEPTVVGSTAGTFSVVASSAAVSNQATFLITVEGAELAVSELRVVSNDPAGFAVQALDDFGQAVPSAALEFCAPASGPSGTFQGSQCILMTANEQGIAIAPPFVNNGVPGNGEVTVTAVGTNVTVAIRFQIKRNDSGGGGGGGGGTCKHDSKGGHKHDGKHPGKDC